MDVMTTQEPDPALLKQLPMCWNDRRLLDYGPFLNWSAMGKDIVALERIVHPDCVKAYITGQDKEFCKAFIRWCHFVFRPLNDEDRVSAPKIQDFITDSSYWDVFVKVFYLLFRNQQKDDKTLELVDNKRKNLRYSLFLQARRSRLQVSRNGEIEVPASLSSPDPLVAGPTNEIDAACEAFMKMLPDGETRLVEPIEIGRRPRRSVPSQKHIAELARKDEELKRELKASDAREKRRRKQQQRRGENSRGHGVKKVQDKSSLTKKNHKLPQMDAKNTSRRANLLAEDAPMCFAADTIVVDNTVNEASSIFVDRIDDAPGRGDDTRVPKKHTPEVASARNKKKQKTSDHEKVESPSLTFNVLDCTQSCSISMMNKEKKKKRKDRGGGDETRQKSLKLTPALAVNPCFDHSKAVMARSTKKRGGLLLRIDSGGARDELPHAGAFRVGVDPDPPISVSRTSSTSSDDTLVEDAVREGNNFSKEIGGRHDGRSVTKVAQIECDEAENHIRLEKMAASLKMSRLQSSDCWPKPPIPGGRRPLIWAASRQALCETTSWFRSYHGGVYFNDGKAHGYLLGGHSSQRDVFCHDGKLIVSHGGGKAFDGSRGQRDQDASVRALLYNYRMRHPLILIADDKYALFPFDLGGMMYVVLGLYWIVAAWAEKDVSEVDGKLDARTKYKFAFQYCESQGPPWWLGNSSDMSSDGLDESILTTCRSISSGQPGTHAISETYINVGLRSPWPSRTAEHNLDSFGNNVKDESICPKCRIFSQRIYKQGWICFNPDCPDFFRVNTEEMFTLDYEEGFLELRPQPCLGTVDLRSPAPICMPDDSADSVYSIKGWCCQSCGQLCPRERWECWECLQCKITFPVDVPLPIRSHVEFSDQEEQLGDYTVYKIYDNSGISVSAQNWTSSSGSSSGLHYIFKLPDDLGQINLICGNVHVNDRANALFRQYQEDARDRSFLRRYPLRFHHARGRMLTNYFSHNAGVPYEYAVTTNITDTFDRAPASVNGALQLIKDRASIITREDADFNEILTAAYMAEQKMSYHTDDERGLGPVVASLSLGSTAFMHFRQRRTSDNSNIDRKLTLVLRHGDVLVMQGAQIQKKYEHSVVPMNFRIAATARCINQDAQPSVPYALSEK